MNYWAIVIFAALFTAFLALGLWVGNRNGSSNGYTLGLSVGREEERLGSKARFDALTSDNNRLSREIRGVKEDMADLTREVAKHAESFQKIWNENRTSAIKAARNDIIGLNRTTKMHTMDIGVVNRHVSRVESRVVDVEKKLDYVSKRMEFLALPKIEFAHDTEVCCSDDLGDFTEQERALIRTIRERQQEWQDESYLLSAASVLDSMTKED